MTPGPSKGSAPGRAPRAHATPPTTEAAPMAMLAQRRPLAGCAVLLGALLLGLPASARSEDAAAAGEAARTAKRAQRKEDNWLKAILACPLCKGKEVLRCYHPCREGGGGMAQCLSGCMTNNPMVLDMMLRMVPKEEPAPSGAAEPNASEGGAEVRPLAAAPAALPLGRAGPGLAAAPRSAEL
ncbi:unnamed protein product [Prorocentrum cordatum]|uniref:Uncharacterized protein n=1 Tax=Prorocentrum cordatum TaxID=2364126 RepID=A0ABN9TUN3_9DINO|nr:unnamed protein product [Polarella glacialis]